MRFGGQAQRFRLSSAMLRFSESGHIAVGRPVQSRVEAAPHSTQRLTGFETRVTAASTRVFT